MHGFALYRQKILSAFHVQRRGVLMMDVLLGLAIFSIFVGFIVVAMLFSQRGLLIGGDRMRAVFLTQRAMEGVKAVRDSDYALLIPGTYGVDLSSEGKWQLTGTGVVSSDYFVTSVTLTSESTGKTNIVASTSWDQGIDRSGAVELHAVFSDWRSTKFIGNWANISLEGSYVDEGTPLFTNAVVSEGYAYVTVEQTGGPGLYIFDISSLSSPIRVNEGFSLSSPAYDIGLGNGFIVVLTDAQSSEIQIFDISNPLTLSTENRIGTINLPDNALGRSLALYDTQLFVGMAEDSDEQALYSYSIENPASPTAQDSLDDAGTYHDIFLHEGYAYIASSSDTRELAVVDVYDISDLTFAPGNGYNLTDTPNAQAIIAAGNYVLLGRENGDAIEEFILFDVSSTPVPVPPPGPWYFNAGASVNGLDTDPSGTYAFAATSLEAGEMRVLDIDDFASGGSPFVDSYNTTTGEGRGIYYSPELDRVFLMTNKGFLIIEPG